MKCIWLLLLCLAVMGCGEGTQDATANREPPAPRHPGESTYNKFCFSCHAAGIAGAPKAGDVEAWAPRAATGSALLLKSTIDGILPGMPAMGLCMQCSEAELAAAIDFMVPGE